MKRTQIAQNKMLRMMENCRIRDRKSVKEMLERNEMMSVNQVAAQIKLTEAWKAVNDEKYPVSMKRVEQGNHDGRREVRPETRRGLEEGGRTKIARESFVRDAGRIWNQAPTQIKTAKTIEEAKRKIKEYCKALPI